MSGTIINLILQIVAGAIGGNAPAAFSRISTSVPSSKRSRAPRAEELGDLSCRA